MYLLIIVSVFCTSCTKDNFIDTGICNGRFDGNVIDYMKSSPYDWDSTRLMIEHSGEDMVRLFKGEDPQYPEITFLGITNHSIRRYMLHNGIKCVTDLDKEWCRQILLNHIINGKIKRADIPIGKQGEFGTVGTGGKIIKTLSGKELWIYTVLEELGFGAGENLPKHIYVNFMSTENFAIASGDIEPDNAIVHALEYKYTLGDSEGNMNPFSDTPNN